MPAVPLPRRAAPFRFSSHCRGRSIAKPEQTNVRARNNETSLLRCFYLAPSLARFAAKSLSLLSLFFEDSLSPFFLEGIPSNLVEHKRHAWRPRRYGEVRELSEHERFGYSTLTLILSLSTLSKLFVTVIVSSRNSFTYSRSAVIILLRTTVRPE